MSTDMELRSALSGNLLRLQVSYAKGVPDVVMGNGEEDKTGATPVLYSEVQQPPPVFYPQGGFFPPLPPGFPVPVAPVEGQPITTPTFVGPFGGRGHYRGGRGGRGGFGYGHHHGHGHGYGAGAGCGKYSDPNGPWSFYTNQVDQILQMGFDVKREKVYKLLKKFDGDVDQVTKKLLWKREKQARREAKKEMKDRKD